MPLPVYTYGKVSGLSVALTVISERAESPMVCCGYCSGHMAAKTAKAGLSNSMRNEAHAIRSAGGRPHNAPSKASEIRAGASKAIGVEMKSVAIADIPARLRLGYAIAFMCDYSELPAHLKVQKNAFVHDVCLYGWQEANDRVGFFDPLWTQGAAGAWGSWSAISKAARPNGNHLTTTVRLSQAGGGTMSGNYVLYDEVESGRVGQIADETPMYNDTQCTDLRGKVQVDGGGKASIQVFGYEGTGASQVYAVRTKTSQGYSDGKARLTNVFVKASAVTGIVTEPICPPVPTPVPPPSGDDYDEGYAQGQRDEWDEWAAGLGVPQRPA